LACSAGDRAYAAAVTVDHWERIYTTRASDAVGWFEADPTTSRQLIADAMAHGARSVIDIGGGASRLVDHLLDLGLERIAVLDIAASGLAVAQERLGPRAGEVEWIVGDVTAMPDLGRFDVWHDRAVFHFLLEPEPRHRYAELARQTVRPGGHAIVATFASDGPERCSGLPVCRYEPEALAHECGPAFRLTGAVRHLHYTPTGFPQSFQYATFDRVAA
jgi:SAM-dependent methyltransferase